jgi:hypothetical protein
LSIRFGTLVASAADALGPRTDSPHALLGIEASMPISPAHITAARPHRRRGARYSVSPNCLVCLRRAWLPWGGKPTQRTLKGRRLYRLDQKEVGRYCDGYGNIRLVTKGIVLHGSRKL